MNIRAAYDRWSITYDTDINLTRDLDLIVTENNLADLKFNSVIELGCGTGKNTALLSQIAKTVRAMDFSEQMLLQAQAKLKLANVSFSVADITQHWPCPDRSADLVVANLVLEHVENLSWIFSEDTGKATGKRSQTDAIAIEVKNGRISYWQTIGR